MPKLETERLILRDWDEKDVADLVEGLNNLNVSRWLAMVPHPYTIEDALKWIAFCLSNDTRPGERTAYHFAIELKAERKVIGGTSLENISKARQTAGGGIWLNEKYHGHGYGSEAFGERVRFAFEDLDLRRLENGYFEGNASSFLMQQRLGYQLEGMRRKAFKCMATGEVMDEYITGLLKEDWKS